MKEIKKTFARTLRKGQTKAEKIVWELLRKRKFKYLKFRRQHVIEGFVIDFYCHELRLGVEVDGGIHLKRKDYDRLRQEVIESEGIKIIRVLNNELIGTREMALKKLEEIIVHQSIPLPLGEGSQEQIFDKRKSGEG
jgi:very-short-patch-repair endonuclease